MNGDVQPVRGSITQASLRMMQDNMNAWSKKPLFVMLAREICKLASAVGFEAESKAIWAWVRKNVVYRADPVGTQWIQDPVETGIISKAGNCANMAILCGTLLQALGHSCKAIAVKWVDRPTWSHAVCYDERTGHVIDAVSPTYAWPPPGRQVEAMMEAS